jgi:hypothetical protein
MTHPDDGVTLSMTDTTLERQNWLGDEDASGDELPRRPRRRLVTPATAGFTAVIIAAAGFVGGVEVQKGSAPASATAPARPAGSPPTAAVRPAGAALTTGQVKSKDGSTLYVTGADGNTGKVKTNRNSKIARNASASVGAIRPGDTVVIQGTTAGDGTVTATNVNATANGVTGVGGGFGGFRGGGAAAGGGGGTR